MISFSYPSIDGTHIAAYKWINNKEAKGIVQIAHGMAEHAKRYHHFANFLNSEGYIVYANDHRGHGSTAGCKEKLGHFANENGWELVVDDLYVLTGLIKKEQSDLPIFLFGHSMGSFLSRRYIQKYGKELSGLILSGTGRDPGALGNMGRALAKLFMRYSGKTKKSKLFYQLSFGRYNQIFRPNRTEFDWLTRDEEEVDQFIKDPYCGEIATVGFFYDLLTGMKLMEQRDEMKRIPKDLPIFLISGEKDPVGEYTKGVLQAYYSYKEIGMEDLNYKFYKDGRHEILNELNRDEVYHDIVRWLNQHVRSGIKI
ncbi:alpha/beta hydrolase [Thermoflavimicrobium daqui]|jgi:alpha-beta hydrolase superfamily lysophospholipase|uniref:Alpha/beta hydrolase n=1 Tax=Thermoflavimicrobium daqui TaxID=2137476 RepID=A0A364K9Y2_9BACL|nr:alpha/beta hydrolase [Thermoflavimicrobium daqui]RAL27088.1 alpha/beta hydrolase [Thermoflavimicrobium daqui]